MALSSNGIPFVDALSPTTASHSEVNQKYSNVFCELASIEWTAKFCDKIKSLFEWS